MNKFIYSLLTVVLCAFLFACSSSEAKVLSVTGTTIFEYEDEKSSPTLRFSVFVHIENEAQRTESIKSFTEPQSTHGMFLIRLFLPTPIRIMQATAISSLLVLTQFCPEPMTCFTMTLQETKPKQVFQFPTKRIFLIPPAPKSGTSQRESLQKTQFSMTKT